MVWATIRLAVQDMVCGGNCQGLTLASLDIFCLQWPWLAMVWFDHGLGCPSAGLDFVWTELAVGWAGHVLFGALAGFSLP
jgi:hypothetical protein